MLNLIYQSHTVQETSGIVLKQLGFICRRFPANFFFFPNRILVTVQSTGKISMSDIASETDGLSFFLLPELGKI